MNIDLGIMAICASTGVAGGILLAWLKMFARRQGIVTLATIAGFVAACLMNDELNILPNPTLKAWSSLATRFAPMVALPFLGAWFLTFLARKFWADAKGYLDERFGNTPLPDAREE